MLHPNTVQHQTPCEADDVYSRVSEPQPAVTGRKLPLIWLCDGEGQSIGLHQLYQKSWKLGIVMSYPVSSSHLMHALDGPSLCHTITRVSMRFLEFNDLEYLSQTFLTDIFPYVGHPVLLGLLTLPMTSMAW